MHQLQQIVYTSSNPIALKSYPILSYLYIKQDVRPRGCPISSTRLWFYAVKETTECTMRTLYVHLQLYYRSALLNAYDLNKQFNAKFNGKF